MGAVTMAVQDLQTLLNLSDPRHRGESVDGIWESTLSTVKALVPCDAVTFLVQDVGQRRVLAYRQWDDGYEVDVDPHDGQDEQYWAWFWSSDCSYPQRSGDYLTVTKASDRSRRPLIGGANRTAGPVSTYCHAARVPLPPRDALDHRLILWRQGGRDFSERDVVLLSILRPHIVAIRDATFACQPGPPELTARQRQLLNLVATGLTNRQAARQLGVSEHTVRKHVENIFERLQVTSRTAAVARAFPGRRSA
jgi:DNA-binding CsgD family transcriptional regulator